MSGLAGLTYDGIGSAGLSSGLSWSDSARLCSVQLGWSRTDSAVPGSFRLRYDGIGSAGLGSALELGPAGRGSVGLGWVRLLWAALSWYTRD